MFRSGIPNILLRVLTLGSRFLLLLFMARYFSFEDLGRYGLMAATIGLTIFLLGLEFYTFNGRELLGVEERRHPVMVRDQLLLHFLTYSLVLPLTLGIFFAGLLPWTLLVWFLVLVVLEHLSQEAYRLFTTLSKPFIANLVLFIRSAAWIFVVMALMALVPATRTLSTIWIGWTVGGLLSLVVSTFLLGMKWRDTTHVPIDWTWIRRGVFASLPFIGSSVALKAIETVDRYILKQHWNEGLVGVYTFYASIANAMQALLYSGIIMVLYPSVVRAFQAGEMGEYRRLMRKLAGGTLVGSLAFIAVGSVAILPVLHMIGKPLYWEHLDAYWILLVSAGAVCIGSVPHFGLYARRQDRTLMLCALASFGLGLALNFLLVPQWGIKGAAVSTCSAFISLALFKTLALFGQWKARSA